MKYFKFNKIIFILIITLTIPVFSQEKFRVHIINDYSKKKILRNSKIIKIIQKNGVKYFEELNLGLLRSIKDNKIKEVIEYVNKGADVRTGIYYAARLNNIKILKELFKYDKIDFNNEIYFLDKEFFIEKHKAFKNIKLIKSGSFIIYQNYNYQLKSILNNVNLMNLNTLKLILKNSFNKEYFSYDSKNNLFHYIEYIKDFKKMDLLITKLNIDIFDKSSSNVAIINDIIKRANYELVKKLVNKYLNIGNINFKNNFWDYNIYEYIYVYEKNNKEKYDFLKTKGGEIFLKRNNELYENILHDNKEAINKLILAKANPTYALAIYLMMGNDCKLKKNKKCIIRDKNCDKLDLFLKYKIDYKQIYPYSKCKNKNKYKVFDKVKDLNKKRWDNTALGVSVSDNNIEQLKYLLKRGANPNIIGECCNHFLFTPLDAAIRDKNKEIIKLLKKYKAKKACEILKTSCYSGEILNLYKYKTY